jgi:hypothetical protein
MPLHQQRALQRGRFGDGCWRVPSTLGPMAALQRVQCAGRSRERSFSTWKGAANRFTPSAITAAPHAAAGAEAANGGGGGGLCAVEAIPVGGPKPGGRPAGRGTAPGLRSAGAAAADVADDVLVPPLLPSPLPSLSPSLRWRLRLLLPLVALVAPPVSLACKRYLCCTVSDHLITRGIERVRCARV